MHPLLRPLAVFAQTRLDTHTPSFMRPAGAPGGVEATLGWWLTAVSIAVVVIVIALLILGLARKREGAPGEQRPGQTTDDAADTPGGRQQVVSGVSWIYVGAGATVVILLIAFGGTLVTLAHAARPDRKAPITLDVIAHQWWWEVRVEDSLPSDAFVTANEVHVPVGVPVHLRLQSYDVIHSFWVPELGGKIDVIPGQVNEGWLRADRAGIYRGQCAEYCGLQHAKMAFTVVADPPARWNQWATSQRAAARDLAPAVDSTGMARTGAHGEPSTTAVVSTTANVGADTTAAAGEAVFVSSCGSCHTVRGTDALGTVGPDLTHVASRLTIGAGMLDNSPATLTTWIRDPQAVKPGAFMPRIDLREQQLHAVVAYLQTLR